jgi:hypothetical protein
VDFCVCRHVCCECWRSDCDAGPRVTEPVNESVSVSVSVSQSVSECECVSQSVRVSVSVSVSQSVSQSSSSVLTPVSGVQDESIDRRDVNH